MTTLAGTPGTPGFVDGQGSNAQFYSPADVAFDPTQGSTVAYIVSRSRADSEGNRIEQLETLRCCTLYVRLTPTTT